MPQEFMPETTSEPRARRRWWVAGVLVAGLAIIIALWWRSAPSAGPTASEQEEPKAAEAGGAAADSLEIEPDIQRAVGLAVQPVEQRAIAETIQTTGVVGPDETRLARVRPLAEGRVTRVAVRVGDRVGAGQTLLVYDSITAGQLVSDYRSAVATLERANAEADVAMSPSDRSNAPTT
jgi:multidrug efflux pump subunit AcrA (membrane-fusion protein)